jgi:hypothetical protein
MGQAEPGKTRGLTGTGPGLARQHAAGWVLVRFSNRTELFFLSEPGPLAGFPDPLLTLTPGRVSTSSSLYRLFGPLTETSSTNIPITDPR